MSLKKKQPRIFSTRNGFFKTLIIILILISQTTGYCLAIESHSSIQKTDDYLFVERAFNQEWVYKTQGEIWSIPAVANLDESEALEIVFGTSAGDFICLDNKGKQQWLFEANNKIESSPTIVDLDNDHSLEILFGANDGHLYCLSANGQQLWNFSTNQIVCYSSPLAIDLDYDATKEVIMGFQDSVTYCLNANGTLRWSFKTDGFINAKAAAEDIDGDGQIELLFGTILLDALVGKLYCLSHEGILKWSFDTEGWINALTPLLFDMDNDGKKEIFFGCDDKNVYCLDCFGEKIWSYNTGGNIRGSAQENDLENDGVKELVVPSDNNLYCFTFDGKVKWVTDLGSNAWTSPVITELNGDNFSEILIGTMHGGLLLMNHQGKLQGVFEMEEIKVSYPFVGDINNDGQLEIVACATSHRAFCLTLSSMQITSLGITVIIGSLLIGTSLIGVSLRTIIPIFKERRK